MGNINPESYYDLFGNGELFRTPDVSLDSKFIWLTIGEIYAILVIVLLLILVICKIRRIRPVYKNLTATIYLIVIALCFILTPVFLPSIIRNNSQTHLTEMLKSLASCSSLKITNSPAMVEYLCNPDFMGRYLTEAEKSEAKPIFEEFVIEDHNVVRNLVKFLSPWGYTRVIQEKSNFNNDANIFSIVEIYKDGKSVEHFKVTAGDNITFDWFERYGPFMYLSGFIQNMNKHPAAVRYRCARSLRNIWVTFHETSIKNNHSQYPDPNSWCNQIGGFILLGPWEIPSECCGGDPCKKSGYSINPDCDDNDRHIPDWKICQCKYAMNPNCGPNSLPDTVCLFESRPGWNQFGGPEILDANHHQPPGCNILFRDGSIRFVNKEDLGKLRWQ